VLEPGRTDALSLGLIESADRAGCRRGAAGQPRESTCRSPSCFILGSPRWTQSGQTKCSGSCAARRRGTLTAPLPDHPHRL